MPPVTSLSDPFATEDNGIRSSKPEAGNDDDTTILGGGYASGGGYLRVTVPGGDPGKTSDDTATLVMALEGELDLSTCPLLRSLLYRAIEVRGFRRLVLDVANLEHADSFSLGMLLEVRGELKRAGGGLVLSGAVGKVARMLEITGTAPLFHVAPTVAEAAERITATLSTETVTADDQDREAALSSPAASSPAHRPRIGGGGDVTAETAAPDSLELHFTSMLVSQENAIPDGATAPSVVVIEAVGELNVYTAPTLRDRLYDLFGRGKAEAVESVVLSMRAIRYIDSVGLGVLLSVQTKARASGVGFALAGITGQVERLFNAAGFTRLFVVAPDVEAAQRVLEDRKTKTA